MPLEIRELNIRVNVNQPKASGGPGSSESVSEQSGLEKTDTDKVVSNTTEQILEILANKKER